MTTDQQLRPTTDTTTRDNERAVLGACLLSPTTAVRPVLEVLNADDFADVRLGRLYGVIAAMYGNGTPIDAISVYDHAAQDDLLHGRITPVDVHDLMSATPTAANVGYYVRQVKDAAGKRRLQQFGARCTQLADATTPLAQIMTLARDEWAALSVDTSAQDLDARPLGDVLNGPDDYDWLIPQLLERQDRLVLTGGEGAGKSTFVRQVAICAAAGLHPTTFATIDPIRVLVVDAENTEKQWRRAARPLALKARHRGQADPTRTLLLACTRRLDITTEKDLGAVHRLIDEHQPDLLVIGPLYRLLPRAITNDDDAAPLLTALDSLRARGIAMVMEAHAGHAQGPGGERDMRPRGSAALMGWPEFGMGIAVDRQAVMPGQAPSVFNLVRWRGDRDERAWPDKLIRGGEWPWTDEKRASGIGPTWSPSRGAVA